MGDGDLAAPVSQDLDSLAHEINRRHQLADAAYRTSVEYALGVGRLLAEAKGRMPYGAWLPWLASNVSFSVRTAQRYVQLADEDAPSVAHFPTMTAALAALSPPASERQAEPPAATTDLSERLREAGRERARGQPQRPPGERATLRDLDAAREELDRQMRRAGRRDGDDRAEAARRGATAARRVGDLLDVLAAGLAA
jgi:hypothetical protein